MILDSVCFNEKNIDLQKCELVLTKIIYLLDKGEVFQEEEMSNLFFSITKLFSSDNKNLKRLLYLCIKYMKDTPSLCMITNCITKDITSSNCSIKANALRLLPLILETQNPIQLERTLKMSLVYKNELVVDASLSSCM